MAVSRIDEAGLNVTQYGNRNLIINGAMQVAQRGTSTTGITSTGYYTSDRWRLEGNTDATFTMENVSDSPDGFSNSTKVTVTTADTSIGATQYGVIGQRIEAQNLQHLKYGTSSAQEVTLSFWVKASTTDGFTATLEHGDAGLYVSKPITINSANTWEYKTFTFVGETSTAINNDNGIGLHVYLLFAAGSTYNTGASSTWTSVGALGGGINNDWIGTTNATVQITGVQLEVGDTATGFEHRSYGEELQRCQRYLTQFTVTSGGERILIGAVESSTRSRHDMPLAAPMRATPTITTNGSPLVYEGGTSRGFSNPQITAVNNSLAGLKVDISSATATNACMIRLNSTSDYIRLDAEL